MNAYMLLHTGMKSSDQMQTILNGTNAIATWISPFPTGAILLSNLNVHELTAVLHVHFGDMWFLLSAVDKDKVNGFLPQNIWSYLNDPDGTWQKNFMERLALARIPPPPPLTALSDLLRKK